MESWYGHLLPGGFLEQHDQQMEQVEVNGIALVDGEKIFGEVVGGQKKS